MSEGSKWKCVTCEGIETMEVRTWELGTMNRILELSWQGDMVVKGLVEYAGKVLERKRVRILCFAASPNMANVLKDCIHQH